MSDIDDELLALAGGGESSEDESLQPRSRRSQAAASDDEDGPMNVSHSGSRHSSPRDGSGSPPPKHTPTKKGRRPARGDESEDEVEASSRASTPMSLESAPMDESDSDSDGGGPNHRRGRAADDDDDDVEKYPVDGLFASYDEKDEIMSMREVDREQILAERAQEKDRIHQSKLLRQLVSNDEQRKKRSASTADLDDSQRKASRARTKEAPSAMDTLKTRRAEKNERNRRREEDRERRKNRSSSRGRHSDDSGDEYGEAGGDSDVEWSKAKSKARSRSPDARTAQPTELRDVERVRLGRSRFGQVCFYPGFDDTIKGSFVRISIGPDPDTHMPVYRMAQVKGFSKGKPYAITNAQGQSIVTDQYVVAAHGKAQREWPFLACSDSGFTEAEWARYRKTADADGVSLPKKSFLLGKAEAISALINRPWTDQELTEKIDRQRELKLRFSNVGRMQIERAMKEARANGDFERLQELQRELETMETPRLAFKTSLTPGKKESTGPTEQERLALLNAENRRHNAEAVRKAQLRERMKTHKPEHRADADAKPAAKPKDGVPPHLQRLQEQKAQKGLPVLHRPVVDDDVIASLEIDLDDDIFD